MYWKSSLTLIFYLFNLIILTLPCSVHAETKIVSVSPDGANANGRSYFADLSQNGRYLTFVSEADNLVVGDTNGFPDIFVYDRTSGEIKRVSVASDGTESNGVSGFDPPRISGDGRYVVFRSRASNLVPDDTNGLPDIFMHDTQTNLTQRVSITDAGTQANSYSWAPDISIDGRFVAFDSNASNLVAGDTNGQNDIFVHDMETGINSRVNVASDGTQANAGNKSYIAYRYSIPMSADNRYVAFTSRADNLVTGDDNGAEDVFVHDRQTGVTEIVRLSSTGEVGYGGFLTDMSANGRFVIVDGFLHDRDTGKTQETFGYPFGAAAISEDGRYITGICGDEDLSPWGDDADNICVFDQQTEIVTYATSFHDGDEVNNNFSWIAISGDGKYIGFGQNAEILPYNDVFITENPFLFSINTGLNDAWYNPETPGQGFWITVYPELGKVALAWLTYDTELPANGATANLGDPGHRWLTALGNYVDNQVFMNITLTSGGIFDASSDVQRTSPKGSDGTIILTFNNCNSAIIEYDITSIDRQGIIPIQRIAGDNIETCEALNTD